MMSTLPSNSAATSIEVEAGVGIQGFQPTECPTNEQTTDETDPAMLWIGDNLIDGAYNSLDPFNFAGSIPDFPPDFATIQKFYELEENRERDEQQH